MLSGDIEAYDEFCDRTAPDECPVCGVDCRCSGPYVGEDVASAVIAAAKEWYDASYTGAAFTAAEDKLEAAVSRLDSAHADRWLDARGNLIAELAKHVDDGEAMDRIVKLADAYAEVR